MKFTILVTNRCNLRCDYCYIGKGGEDMDAPMAAAVVDWIFTRAGNAERIDIGLFGGEPLIALDAVRKVVDAIETHRSFDHDRVDVRMISNGTLFNGEIASFLREHDIGYGLSIDGPPEVQDRFRRFADGRGSGEIVERNARAALEAFDGRVPVNAVYRPETLRHLPETVQYLAGLGFRHIYLSPDLLAPWTEADANALSAACEAVADVYIDSHLRGDPLVISMIDGKIAVLLRGGFRAVERCGMGVREFAFTTDGRIYPCERLVGCGSELHRIGSVASPDVERVDGFGATRPECAACSLGEYCVHWCGCSNFFSTGHYGRTGAVLCAAERAWITAAARAFETIEERLGPTFVAHLTGHPTAIVSGMY